MRLWGKLLRILLIVFLAFSCQGAEAVEESKDIKLVRVGQFSMGAAMYENNFGHKGGYAYEYLQQLAAYTGWRYEYVQGSFAELYHMLLAGKIDLLPELNITEERKGKILYPDHEMGDESIYICMLDKYSRQNRIRKISQLSGRWIGVAKNTAEAKAFEEFLKENNLHMEVFEYDDREKKFQDLYKGLLAYSVESDTVIREDCTPVLKIGTEKYFLGVNKDRPDVLRELNEAQQRIYSADPLYNEKLRQKHLIKRLVAKSLSEEAEEWINGNKLVRIGCLDNDMPFSNKTLLGQPEGAIIMLATRMFNGPGMDELKVKYSFFSNEVEMEQALQQGRIDLCFPIYHNLSLAEVNGYVLSSEVGSSPMSVVYKKENIEKIFNFIGVYKTEMAKQYAQNFYPHARRTHYDKLDDCVNALMNDRITSVVMHSQTAQELVKNNPTLRIYPLNAGCPIAFATTRDKATLMEIVDRGIASMTDIEMGRLIMENSMKAQEYTAMDFIQEHSKTFAVFAVIFLAALVTSLAMWWRSNKIQQNMLRKNSIITGLLNDYDCINYIKLNQDKQNDVIMEEHLVNKFNDMVPGLKQEKAYGQRLRYFENSIVSQEDRQDFHDATRREKILEGLEEANLYKTNFRAFVDGNTSYYQLKYTPDRQDGKLVGFVEGVQNIDEQVKEEVEREKKEVEARNMAILAKHLKEEAERLQRINEDVIRLMGDMVEFRDEESGEHIKRVRGYTDILANEVMKRIPRYGLTPEKVAMITSASALHDVGKITIPDAVLLKPGKFTPEEFEIMKQHTTKGLEILAKAPREWGEDYIKISSDICVSHHEKWDGKGYPYGLKGDEIPIAAQIVSVADCFDALVSKRVYKGAFSCDKALDMIMEGACGQFSPELMECLSACRKQFSEQTMSGAPQGTCMQ